MDWGGILKQFLLALQFLTRIPVIVRGTVIEEDMARSMAWYPMVGLFIGGGAAAVNVILSYVFTPPVCDLFSIIFLIVITGNMHMDGLMDAADGFFSGKPRDRILEIMKDSRVGSHGVIAGCIVFALKLVLLIQLPQEMKVPALIVIPVLGRWSQVYGAKVYTYARVGEGTGAFTDHVGWREITWATITAGLVVAALFKFMGIFIAIPVLLGTLLLFVYVYTKLKGITGDSLGAVTECVEVLVLLTLQQLPPIL